VNGCEVSVRRRAVTAALAGLVATLAVLVAAPASATVAKPRPPDCPPVTVMDSTKQARAVFSGTVEEVERRPRTDGVRGALYEHRVSVGLVYQGKVRTETVQVQTDRNRGGCSLGALSVGTEYMFFVTGSGDPWVASGTSGTCPDNATVTAQVERILGAGEPPVSPAAEEAVFTPVDAGEPESLSRAAAPGAALVIVGLLGLVVVRGLSRRSR